MSHNAENWVPRGERKQINTKMRGLPYKWHMELTPEGQRAVIEPRNGLESIANVSGGTSGQVSGENAATVTQCSGCGHKLHIGRCLNMVEVPFGCDSCKCSG